MARPGIEPKTSDSPVICRTDCATRPGRGKRAISVRAIEVLLYYDTWRSLGCPTGQNHWNTGEKKETTS